LNEFELKMVVSFDISSITIYKTAVHLKKNAAPKILGKPQLVQLDAVQKNLTRRKKSHKKMGGSTRGKTFAVTHPVTPTRWVSLDQHLNT
jgi:hypothetical protein